MGSTPYSEGTGSICRVPWPEFSRAPWIIHPIHLSWFAVRFARSKLRSFSWQPWLNSFRAYAHGLVSRLISADLPAEHAYALAPDSKNRPVYHLRPFFAQSHKYRIINPFPISYAFQPGLRVRLTLGRLPLPRKPWIYGEYVFHIFYRYSCQHNHFSAVHETFRFRFSPQRTLPYQLSETNPKLRQHA